MVKFCYVLIYGVIMALANLMKFNKITQAIVISRNCHAYIVSIIARVIVVVKRLP